MEIPPLPPTWPYAPRPGGVPAVLRTGLPVPGETGVWTFVGAGDLILPEDSEGLAFGRGGVRRAGDVVIRPYRRGGLVRHLVSRTYLGCGRFRREWAVHQALWAAGFPTVEPLGYAFRPLGPGMEGLFLTRYVPSVPWPRAWDRSGEVLPALGRMLGALCAWGLHAPDLNATNVLLGPSGVLALDWDRASWTSARGLDGRYRLRLARSLAKLGAPPGILEGLSVPPGGG